MTTKLAEDLKRGRPLDDEIIAECIALWGSNGPQAFIMYLELFNRRRASVAMERGLFGEYYSEAQNREFFVELTASMRKDYLYDAWKKGQDLRKIGETVDHFRRLLEKKLFGAERKTWVKGR